MFIIDSLQLDPGNSGKISAGDAAQFLKKSGLSDSTLGKVGHTHIHPQTHIYLFTAILTLFLNIFNLVVFCCLFVF